MADAATMTAPKKDMGQSWNKPEDNKLMKLGERHEPNKEKSMAPGSFKEFLQCQAKNKENRDSCQSDNSLSSDACLLQRA
jgi:hypothetical protein